MKIEFYLKLRLDIILNFLHLKVTNYLEEQKKITKDKTVKN